MLYDLSNASGSLCGVKKTANNQLGGRSFAEPDRVSAHCVRKSVQERVFGRERCSKNGAAVGFHRNRVNCSGVSLSLNLDGRTLSAWIYPSGPGVDLPW